jgi:hypothetical protein
VPAGRAIMVSAAMMRQELESTTHFYVLCWKKKKALYADSPLVHDELFMQMWFVMMGEAMMDKR